MKLFTMLCIAVITVFAKPAVAQSKYKYDTDKIATLYYLLEKGVNAEKLYGYKKCFVMEGDSIKGVIDTSVTTYLAYIKSIDVFSEGYLKDEKKWFESIKKDLAKKGKTDEKITDKYYGENPEAVRTELLERKKTVSYAFWRYFSSFQRGTHGVFKSTFTKAGYDLKVGATHVGEYWYIDWIRQGRDRD